jgi:hypothetical protein
MNNWTYNGEHFEAPSEEHYGFVYIITNLSTGRMYIGKKLFWFKKIKTLKGKRKRYLAESDWKTYYGSSVAVQKDVKEIGQDQFKREILHLCKSKGECSYYEAFEQMSRAVLLNPNLYYNDWVICRVHRKHILNEEGERKSTPQTNKKARPSVSVG